MLGERRTIAKWVEVVATSEEGVFLWLCLFEWLLGTETVDDVVYSLSDKKILHLEKKKVMLGQVESFKYSFFSMVSRMIC